MSATPAVVLVHGAYHGAWCWERVVRELDGRGVPNHAVELPYTSYEDDEAAVREAIEAAAAPVVLVGHSLGGGLVCAAGDHPGVVKLGFVTAMVVGARESVPGYLERQGVRPEYRSGAPDVVPGIRVNADGWMWTHPAVAATTFFGGCSDEDVAFGLARLRPASPSSMSGVPRGEPWRTKPSGYVFCTRDRAVPLEVQRAFAAELSGPTHELAASHSPMFSHPRELAEIIASWADGTHAA